MPPVGVTQNMGKNSNPVSENSGVKIIPAGNHKPVFDKFWKKRTR
jgi:hypothetical protein